MWDLFSGRKKVVSIASNQDVIVLRSETQDSPRLAFQDSVHNLGRRASFRPRRARCAAVAIRHFGRLRRPYPTEPMGQIVGSGRRGRTIPRHPNHLGRILDGRHLRRTLFLSADHRRDKAAHRGDHR